MRAICRLLGLSPSGYYAWLQRPPSVRSQAEEALRAEIRRIHRFSRDSYGRPRMYAEMQDEAHAVNHKRVGRLMRLDGLVGATRQKKWRTTRRGAGTRPAPDLAKRNFSATGPDHLWVADITYIPTSGGFLLLAVVLDAWSRRLVGWSMESDLRTPPVLQALNMALRQRRPSQVIHHSDQATQYTSIAFGLRCKEAGVQPSMGSVGDAYDNAMCESFFATLECELLERKRFRNRAEVTMRCSTSSKGGTIRAGGTRPLGTARRSGSSGPPARARRKAPSEFSTRCCCERSLRALRSSAWKALRLSRKRSLVHRTGQLQMKLPRQSDGPWAAPGLFRSAPVIT